MTVHQTLHGYADGHRLLVASTPLSTEEQHLIALHSDISGHAAGVNFTSYLSGYPVRPGVYALARTWAATDVSRAGSVWTHTLLLGDEALADVRDVAPLVALFRRPEAGDHLPYSTPLEVPDARLADDREPPPEADAEAVAEVIGHLYHPTSPHAVRVIADDCEPWEPLVLALWLQQWPDLRARFTFCTLALGDLCLGDEPFALQVVPRGRAGGRATDDRIVAVDVGPGSRPAVPESGWMRATVSDLAAAPGDRTLRRFLSRYSLDVTGTRAVFARLADVYAHVGAGAPEWAGGVPAGRLSREGVQRASRLVELVGERFPTPYVAVRLKLALFGGSVAPEPHPTGVSEAETMLALGVTHVSDAFDADALAVADRARRMLDTDSAAAQRVVQMALEIGLSPIGEVALAPLLTGAGGDLLTAAVARNLKLATNAGLWSTPLPARRSLWNAVAKADPALIDDGTRIGIVRAMIDAGCTELADEAVGHFGDTAVRTVLEWPGAGPVSRQLDGAWTRAVGRKPTALLASLLGEGPLGAANLAVLAEALDPDSEGVLRASLDSWLDAATRAAKVSPEPIDFKAFLLAVAFDHEGPEAASLAVLTFQPVYDAAREQKLGALAWSRLQSRVPRILRQWDRCERLRRGVAVRFARGDWPMTDLPQVVRGELTLDLLLGHCLETEAGRRFVVRVVRGVPRPIRWGQAQRAVIQRFVDKAAAGQRHPANAARPSPPARA